VTAVVLDVIDLPPADYDSIAAAFAALPILPAAVGGESVDGIPAERADFRWSLHAPVPATDQSGRSLVLKFPKPAILSERGANLAFLREMIVGSRVQSPFVSEVLSLAAGQQTSLYVALPYYRRRDARGEAGSSGRCHCRTGWRSPARSRAASPRCTASASSTATSSPRMSC
jgi:hypothetical protein